MGGVGRAEAGRQPCACDAPTADVRHHMLRTRTGRGALSGTLAHDALQVIRACQRASLGYNRETLADV